MTGSSRRAFTLALAFALAPLPALAGPRRDDGHRDGPGRVSAPRPARADDPVRLDPQQREAVERWQKDHPDWRRPAPGGTARVPGQLVPGHYHRPPAGLVDLLPRPPRGQAYFAIGGTVVLAVISTGAIVQIVLAGP